MNDNEQNWVDYELEETQSKLDLADMILEQLAGEVVTILGRIHQGRE